MDKLQIVKEITEQITGKKVVSNDKGFQQSSTEIYGTHWIEILHELSHWLVATPEERLHTNLGFLDQGVKGEPSEQNLIQEIRASELNNHLNHLVGFDTDVEKRFSGYIHDANGRMGCKFTKQDIKEIKDGLLLSDDVKYVIKLIKERIE